jgi:hypothetical protein
MFPSASSSSSIAASRPAHLPDKKTHLNNREESQHGPQDGVKCRPHPDLIFSWATSPRPLITTTSILESNSLKKGE